MGLPKSYMAKIFRRALPMCLVVSTIVACCHAQSGALRAGAAKAEITPPLAADMQGPTGKYENEHLYARAIVLDNEIGRAHV